MRLLGSPMNGDIRDVDSICMAIIDYIDTLVDPMIRGFVAVPGRDICIPLSGDENLQAVIDYAALLEEDSWFTHWICAQVSRAAEGKRLTPAEAMISLVEEASQFEADVAITERTLCLYPTLFESMLQEALSGRA
jgi:hypothetical protein